MMRDYTEIITICCRITEVALLKGQFHQLPAKCNPPLHQGIQAVVPLMKNCKH